MSERFPINSTNQIVQFSAEKANTAAQSLIDCSRQIQALLQTFNQGVQNSFKDGGMQGLQAYTTPDGYVRMQEKYATWTKRQVTELNLVSCEFLSFNLAPDKTHARAYTFEKWVFVYADGKTVPTAGSVDGYDLELHEGTWRVHTAVTYAASPD